jgi:HPt (histidine-containing phosphotransfer) domain-containing protein
MFIIDQNHHLIAAEKTDLTRWGFATIYEAAQAFAVNELRLDLETGSLELRGDRSIDYHTSVLESPLGNWYLCVEKKESATAAAEPRTEERPDLAPAQTSETEQAASALEEIKNEEVDEELESLLKLLPEEESVASEECVEAVKTPEEEAPLDLLKEAPEETAHPESEEGPNAPAEEEPLLPLLEEETTAPAVEEERPESEEEPLALAEEESSPLLMEEERVEHRFPHAEETPVSETAVPEWEELEKDFHPNLETNAARLDLESGEYKALVEDLVQDLTKMREQLLSDDPRERHDAIAILKDAVVLLQLSPLDRLLSMLEGAGREERRAIVDTMERMLNSLIGRETPRPGIGERPGIPPEQPSHETTPPSTAPLTEEEKGEATPTPTPTAEAVPVEEFLKGVKPIPISFSLHVAAEELSLPEDLVREFVTDFAKQGHEYLPVLIQAYEEKDLEKLQKTAHMLKGAASNLRVEAMVENLYELQFDNNIERAPERIRKFAGQLMSLDNFLNQLNG